MPTFLKHICDNCNTPFNMQLKDHNSRIKKGIKNSFCSRACHATFSSKTVETPCVECGKKVIRKRIFITINENTFCSRRCNATYHNKNKKFGCNRSKIETWMEEKLSKRYPSLDLVFNDRSVLNGLELDIYIPSLRLAFELNGIFHYQPIFGNQKLSKIQNRDANKVLGCAKSKVDICVLDISALKYFKEQKAQKYLDIIIDIINDRSAEFAFVTN